MTAALAPPAPVPAGTPALVPGRVLHVTEAPLGGVASYLADIATSQAERGVLVDLVTPEVNLPALAGVADPRFRAIAFRHARGSWLGLLRLIVLTLRQAWATRPDILHVHSTFAGVVVRLCRPLLPRGTRIVYCPHGWAFSRRGNPRAQAAVALLERLLSHLCDRIVCVSEHERRKALLAGIALRKLVVIENGVGGAGAGPGRPGAPTLRPEPSAGPPPEPPPGPLAEPGPPPPAPPKRVVFAGRFDRQKGFDTFVEVMRRLGPEASGLAIGDALVSGERVADLPPNVERLGWQPRARVMELYAGADLLLVPSRWEGFGLVAVEAMQARLAVFASRVGGLQDIVVDGQTGRLFDPDDVDEIVALVRGATPEALRAMGERGFRRYLDRYTAERMNDRIMGLYADLLAGVEVEQEDRAPVRAAPWLAPRGGSRPR